MTKRGRQLASSVEETKQLIEDFENWVEDVSTMVDVEAADIKLAIDFVSWDDLVLRGPDALHLAIATRLGVNVLTFDKGMAQAAGEIGIRVVTS